MSDVESFMRSLGVSPDGQVSKAKLAQVLAAKLASNPPTDEDREKVAAEVERMFNDFDQDGEEGLSYTEIKALISESGLLKTCGDIAKAVDKNKDGNISKCEFKGLVSKIPGYNPSVLTGEMLDGFYDRWDKNNDGLSVRECQYGLLRLCMESQKK